MSNIGLLIEGGVDEELLRPLLDRTISDIVNVRPGETTYFIVPFPPNGYGEIPKNLKTLIRQYQDHEERERIGCDLFLIIHDSRKTEEIQRQIKRILRDAPEFPSVYALAVQEIEAWVLADIDEVNRRIFRIHPQPLLPTSPERDKDPKKTLTELFVKPSEHIDFDRWNRECARAVAPHVRHDQVRRRCPRGFGRLFDALNDSRRYLVL